MACAGTEKGRGGGGGGVDDLRLFYSFSTVDAASLGRLSSARVSHTANLPPNNKQWV